MLNLPDLKEIARIDPLKRLQVKELRPHQWWIRATAKHSLRVRVAITTTESPEIQLIFLSSSIQPGRKLETLVELRVPYIMQTGMSGKKSVRHVYPVCLPEFWDLIWYLVLRSWGYQNKAGRTSDLFITNCSRAFRLLSCVIHVFSLCWINVVKRMIWWPDIEPSTVIVIHIDVQKALNYGLTFFAKHDKTVTTEGANGCISPRFFRKVEYLQWSKTIILASRTESEPTETHARPTPWGRHRATLFFPSAFNLHVPQLVFPKIWGA